MLLDYKNGQGSIVLRVKLRNSSVTTGAGLAGLTSASSGLIVSTIADNESTATTYTQAGSTIESVTTLGTFAAPTATKCRFKEVDATNHPGVYEIQIADARFAVSNAKSVLVSLSGATNLAQCDVLVPLRTFDPYAAGGKNPATLASTDVTGNVAADIQTIKTQTVTCAGGVTVPAATLASTTNITAGTITTATNLTNAPTAGDFTATMKTSVGTAVAASAVASVTGNVGGNVTGSVGSVAGAVASVSGNVGGNVTGSVGSVASGGITAASLAADCITAAKIADGAIDSATFAAGTTIPRCTLVDTTTTNTDMLTAAGVRNAVGLGSANLDTQLAALPTAAQNATVVLTTQMTESYASNGTAPTLAQAAFAIHQMLMDFVISGTSLTVKKLNNSTTAFVVTLDDATSPTGAART